MSAAAQPRRVLGRCPLDNVVSIQPCRLTGGESPDLLVVQEAGSLELRFSSGRERARVTLRRPAVLSFQGEGFTAVWTGEPGLGREACRLGLSPSPWAVGDVDRDGLDELLLVRDDSCLILSLETESAGIAATALPGARPVEVLCCDVDADALLDLVTLESAPADSGPAAHFLRIWQPAQPDFLPCSPLIPCFPADTGLEVSLLGAARLEDYGGQLPVAAGIFGSVRPSLYAALFRSEADSFALSSNPFPCAEWFSKQQVLPAGRLSLFNVEDTLVAYGYFVPGSRPAGPSQSFAALQDGEWRLLRLAEHAARTSGPVCRYAIAGIDGWLELRDNLFYFSPGDLFHWR